MKKTLLFARIILACFVVFSLGVLTSCTKDESALPQEEVDTKSSTTIGFTDITYTQNITGYYLCQ